MIIKKHVLLVDKDKNQLDHFMSALNEVQETCKCTYAADHSKALEMLKYLHPDIIFVEHSAPDFSGLKLLSIISNRSKLKETRTFIYTETITEEVNKMAKMLGAAGCVEKNGTVNWLTHQLKAIIAGELLPPYVLLKNSKDSDSLT